MGVSSAAWFLAKYAKYREVRQENQSPTKCFLATLAVLGVLGEQAFLSRSRRLEALVPAGESCGGELGG